MENLFTSIRIMPALINFMNTEDYHRKGTGKNFQRRGEMIKTDKMDKSRSCGIGGINYVG